MKKIIIFLLLGFFCYSFGQKKIANKQTKPSKISCYLPNGDKCPANIVGINIYETTKYFEPRNRAWLASTKNKDYKCLIIYKSFTKEPLFVHTFDKQEHSAEEIINMINDTEFKYYFGDYNSGLKMDLQKYIDNRTLTDIFILDTLGSPTFSKESYQNGKSIRFMEYQGYGVRIWFSNSIGIGYDEL
ncbi:hypothetical protein HZQ11_12375 [Elizabethkingia anophelis]|uniref:hypothetical protein n=1 Tax=Elizabethkingia TaxID=308865 RepID=UPI0007399221|nr:MULTISPECIES: hypothetical protein [Elizabethkingia]KUF46421.1 hypothetical protein AS358_14560 [Elizabethkingia anophelis]MCT3645163.1 hypothetical protein [Elizabethkingia anophelis]MCT3652970.1 hypothetical protein [Elizabethkingia anophelis]MCT3656160.1 hypothetical protein [Elizabethkingia anophelis]MCT3660208.1 hypothetical protein [Elizabethkingia anophelis]